MEFLLLHKLDGAIASGKLLMSDIFADNRMKAGFPVLDSVKESLSDCRAIYDCVVVPVRQQLEALGSQADAETNSVDPSLPGKEFREVVDAIYERSHAKANYIIDEVLTELLANRAGFKAVFATEHGSIYFEDHAGTSLRFKASELVDHPGRRLREPFDTMYFVDQETASHLLSTERVQEALAKPIQTYSLAPGLVPIELNLARAGGSVAEDGQLTIRDLQRFRSRDLHVGHAIRLILHAEEK